MADDLFTPAGPQQSASPAEAGAGDDVEALRFLQQAHGPVLLNFLIRLTRGDVHRAEDLVQEALLRTWRAPKARHADGRWSRAYLFAVAKNVFVDQLRAAEARPKEVYDRYIDVHAAIDDPIEGLLERHEVRAAVNSLPERSRRTLTEIYFRERSVQEAAEVLGVPEGTVKSRTFYALRLLREKLAERGYTFRGDEKKTPNP